MNLSTGGRTGTLQSGTRWTACSRVPPPSPLGLGRHFEVAVGGVAPLLVPVLQLDVELVLARRGEGVQRGVPEPVLPLWTPEPVSVLLPRPVEVQ